MESVKRTYPRKTFVTGVCTGAFTTADAVVSRTAFVKEQRYNFTMTDSVGDGEGSYTIDVNDELMRTGTLDNGESSVYFESNDVRNRRLEGGGGDRRLEEDIPILEVKGVALLAFAYSNNEIDTFTNYSYTNRAVPCTVA
jgi:hypothetical protein